MAPETNSGQRPLRRRRLAGLRKVGLVIGFWTLIAVLSAVQAYLSQLLWDKPIGWDRAFRRSFEEWYSWALLSFGILWLARRFSLDRLPLGRWVGTHLGLAVAVSLAHTTMFAALLNGQISLEGNVFEFGAVFRKICLYYMQVNMIIYWVIVLLHHGWHFYHRYREREWRAAALERELTQARLDALRMQLNPHFLFNALHTISSLIHEQPETADRMVARLSELLRFSLDRTDTQEIPLREEIGFLKQYVEIETARFHDRLTVDWQVDPAAEGALVPCLILQPLVENAIRHGIEAREEPGRVTVIARPSGKELELAVSDDGPGASGNGERIGLSNTRSRLQHLYGDRHRLELNTRAGDGFEVRLTLPWRIPGPERQEEGRDD